MGGDLGWLYGGGGAGGREERGGGGHALLVLAFEEDDKERVSVREGRVGWETDWDGGREIGRAHV